VTAFLADQSSCRQGDDFVLLSEEETPDRPNPLRLKLISFAGSGTLF